MDIVHILEGKSREGDNGLKGVIILLILNLRLRTELYIYQNTFLYIIAFDSDNKDEVSIIPINNAYPELTHEEISKTQRGTK